jgi:hypothetical protein
MRVGAAAVAAAAAMHQTLTPTLDGRDSVQTSVVRPGVGVPPSPVARVERRASWRAGEDGCALSSARFSMEIVRSTLSHVGRYLSSLPCGAVPGMRRARVGRATRVAPCSGEPGARSKGEPTHSHSPRALCGRDPGGGVRAPTTADATTRVTATTYRRCRVALRHLT